MGCKERQEEDFGEVVHLLRSLVVDMLSVCLETEIGGRWTLNRRSTQG